MGAQPPGGWSRPKAAPGHVLLSQIIRKQKGKAEAQAEEEEPVWPRPQSVEARDKGPEDPPGRRGRARAPLWVSDPHCPPPRLPTPVGQSHSLREGGVHFVIRSWVCSPGHRGESRALEEDQVAYRGEQ